MIECLEFNPYPHAKALKKINCWWNKKRKKTHASENSIEINLIFQLFLCVKGNFEEHKQFFFVYILLVFTKDKRSIIEKRCFNFILRPNTWKRQHETLHQIKLLIYKSFIYCFMVINKFCMKKSIKYFLNSCSKRRRSITLLFNLTPFFTSY